MLYTGGGFKGYDATYGYVARSLRLLRTAVGRPVVVHAAGGVANRMNAEELKAFTDAVLDDGTVERLEPLRPADDDAAGWAAMAPPHRRRAARQRARQRARAAARASRAGAPASPSRRPGPA